MVIFAIAETKLDSLFPESQFILSGIRKPFRLDVTNRKGGLLMFVNNDIPSKDLRGFHLPRDIQAIPFEINLKQRKLLVVSIYRPPYQNLRLFFCHPLQAYLITTLSLTKTLSWWVILMQMKVIQQWKLF